MSSVKFSTVKNLFWTFLEGPGPNSPVIEMNLVSMMYLVRDLSWLLLAVIPSYLVVLYERIFPREEKDVRGQVVVITGTASGIGRELAIKFAKLGSKVICVDINEEKNEETVAALQEITGNKSSCASYVCDVADPEATRLLAGKIHEKFGHVDILLHNAGILAGASILSTDDKFVRRLLDVNLLSTFWMIRSFLPKMKERKAGHIVINVSFYSITSIGKATVYSAAKGGLAALLDSLSRELREDPATRNIKLSSVHPIYVNTHPEFTKYIRGRLKPRYGSLSPREAARQMVVGIRREYEVFCIPGIRTTYTILSLLRLIPRNLYHMYKDIEGAVIVVPEGQPYVPPPKELFKPVC